MKLFNLSLSKATLTDCISVALIGIGLSASKPIATPILFTGLFAFSGAITNQVAIYMLFNKVPFLYGSGVIEENFENFKASIKNMMMKQFFNKEQLESFLKNEEKNINLAPLVESADFSPAFNALKQSVMESKLGDMLNLFGGEKALDSLQEPFAKKLNASTSPFLLLILPLPLGLSSSERKGSLPWSRQQAGGTFLRSALPRAAHSR